MIMIGDMAPTFTLPNQAEIDVSLESFRGRPVVLYFYPKDDTPGCTKEACDFRDNFARVKEAGAVVLGVSGDDTKSKSRFATKYDLPFPLLADQDHTAGTAYDVYGEKTNYGKTYMGITRTTFLIDKTGKIVRVWRNVKVEGHVDEVLKALEEIK